MNLLIGYDGSDCAKATITDLRRAGLPGDVEARILSVAEVWLPASSALETEAVVPEEPVYAKAREELSHAESLAEQAREQLGAIFPNWQVRAEVAAGSPAWELVFLADHWKPDLVAVGSHGRTALGRFVLGSVSQRVLTEARTSVRISRGRIRAEDLPVKIVLGVDGSEGSKIAVNEVASRRWPANTEVRVVIVDDPLVPAFVAGLLSPLSETVAQANIADRRWAEEVLTNCGEALKSSGLKITTEIKEGNPKRALPELAEAWDADCIFVGSQGFSNRLERFVLGSVSAAVAARAHCSVEVVRAL